MPVTILDGPLGTELLARGVPTPIPLWSAWALLHQPEVVSAIHRDYAAAGATVHTANTFRTKRRQLGDGWAALAARAVTLARAAVPAGHRIAGSVAPLEDCYHPEASPPAPGPEHAELARCLADAGVDLLLCETFPHVGEGLAAVDACVATGVETWASFTAGPHADLLSPEALADACAEAARRGAAAVLVNCVPAARTLDFVAPIADAVGPLGVPFGAYANAGSVDEGMGWAPAPQAPARYLAHAERWVAAGATLIGSCCGTGPAHIRALAERFSGLDALEEDR
ncbi:MAG: homocysteine S-methyltransferase family protein [Alphaproteobacteria bacterium]|nr:homocysteine S-methyltransferase family protein [Alphaproteobacteria bacterium]